MRNSSSVRALAALALAACLPLLGSCGGRQSVLIGVVLPLSGEVAPYGKSIQEGIELAYERVKADEAIPYDVEIEIVDSSGDAEKAADQARELYGKGALAIIGGVSSGEALAMAAVAKREQAVLLSPTASSDDLSGVARTFFRIFPTAIQEASAMANFARETLKVDKLVILVQEGLPFTESLAKAIESVFGQLGASIAEVITFPSDTTDFAPFVDRALGDEPNGIYLDTRGSQSADIIPLLRERGYGRTEGKPEWIMTTSAFAHPVPMAKAGASADGVYLTMTVFDTSSEDGLMPDLVAAYRNAHGGELPNLYVGQGYDSLVLLGEALKGTSSLLSSEMLKGIRGMDPLLGSTGNLQFDDGGNVQKFPRIHMIRDGKLVDFQKWREERMQEMRRKLEEIQQQTRSLHNQALQN